MKRRMQIGVMLALGLLLAFNLWSFAQPGKPSGFIVFDLQLISAASRPDWGDHWSGPVEAATILAWFHEHGYPRLLEDLNNDGVIDELDTIELADILGKGSMKTNSAHGTTDARLIRGLAAYVAEAYPNEFELKIYDPGFPAEYEREFGGAFASDVIPGILLTPKSEPSFSAYTQELQDEEGVIIGIEEEPDHNYYLAGRSFLFEPTSEGYHPVDFAWGKEDRWEPGFQGQVLETEAMETDALYIYYEGQWVKVEFMLALSPVSGPNVGTTDPGKESSDDDPLDGDPKCPDFTIRIYRSSCSCTWSPEEELVCTVDVRATVENIGNESASFIYCKLDSAKGDDQTIIASIAPGATQAVRFEFTYTVPRGQRPVCPLNFLVMVDSKECIDECDETNNSDSASVCCDILLPPPSEPDTPPGDSGGGINPGPPGVG
jgi:hypothetical protein